MLMIIVHHPGRCAQETPAAESDSRPPEQGLMQAIVQPAE